MEKLPCAAQSLGAIITFGGRENASHHFKFLQKYFQLRNTAARQCVDSPAKQDDLHKAVGLWPCHLQGGNQVSLVDLTFEACNKILCFGKVK